MKREYKKPTMLAIELQHQHQILTVSNVIPPGQPNEPAGVHRRLGNNSDDLDDEEYWEEDTW